MFSATVGAHVSHGQLDRPLLLEPPPGVDRVSHPTDGRPNLVSNVEIRIRTGFEITLMGYRAARLPVVGLILIYGAVTLKSHLIILQVWHPYKK